MEEENAERRTPNEGSDVRGGCINRLTDNRWLAQPTLQQHQRRCCVASNGGKSSTGDDAVVSANSAAAFFNSRQRVTG